MITLHEALDKIKQASGLFEIEHIPLQRAQGRILADTIQADRDYPPFNRAAMDGIAIRYTDWENGIRTFTIQEVILAGEIPQKNLPAGSCYKIMTGARCPADADTVIRLEDIYLNDGAAHIVHTAVRQGSHIAKQGEDIKRGDSAIKPSTFCTATVISTLAALGITEVPVFKRPSIALLTTGSELVEPGQAVSPVQIRNSNKYLLSSLCSKWNPEINYIAHAPDDPHQLRQNLQSALQEDLLLINGGVSAGDADFIPALLRELEINILFHRVAIKPGKPLLVGKASNGCMVFALPGNPLSCLTTFTIFVETHLYWASGRMVRPYQQELIREQRDKKNTLSDFFPIYRKDQDYGLYPQKHQGSGDIRSALGSPGIALQPADTPSLKSGDRVTYYPF